MRELLGQPATDKVTGYSGTVTGYACYLEGSESFRVETTDSAGVLRCEWIDAGRLIIPKPARLEDVLG